MLKRTLAGPLVLVAALGLVASMAVITAPAASAATPRGIITICEPGGSIPCLGVLQHPPVIYYGRFGGTEQLPTYDLVLITCYYFGSPVVHGDNIEDHIIELATASGPKPRNGHVPDWNINLGGRNPWQVGIPAC